MDNIEEQLLPTNATSCLSTSTVKKYFLNMMRKTTCVLYIAGTGCLLYGGVGFALNELIKNGYDKNEKTSDNDSYLKFFLVGFGAITIGQLLTLFVKFCDNDNIENRLDQQLTHDSPPAYESVVNIHITNEPAEGANNSAETPPTYEDTSAYIKDANNEITYPACELNATKCSPVVVSLYLIKLYKYLNVCCY